MASLSSTNSNLLPSWPSKINTNSLQGVSFSSYLNNSEEPYIHSLFESKKNMVEEIGVFSAHKYFNEEKTHANVGTINDEIKHFDHHQEHREAVNHPRTPSNQPATSTWNSQSALLKRVPRVSSRRGNSSSNFESGNKSRSTRGMRFFLSCCSCSHNTSADVEEEMIKSPTKTNLEISEITGLNEIRLQKETNDLFNEQRDKERRVSLDVFGSNELDEHGIVERRLKMLSWDAIPQVQIDDVISNGSGSGPPSESYKDTESDASSDLFEISCTANPGVGSTTPTAYYAPSEASVEWSVVTASAADFSAFSECEDNRSNVTSVSKCRKNTPKLSPSNKMNGMLLRCKSQKAVKVAGDRVYRTPVREMMVRERRPRNSDSAMGVTMTRFQAEAKVACLGQEQKKDITLCL